MTQEELDKDMIESIEMWLHEIEPKWVEKELAWLEELRSRLLEEKLEKPMNQDGLENEAVSYCFDNGLNLSPRVATDFARHFAQWGAEHLKK